MAKKGDRPHLYKKEGKVFPCAGTLLPATPSPRGQPLKPRCAHENKRRSVPVLNICPCLKHKQRSVPLFTKFAKQGVSPFDRKSGLKQGQTSFRKIYKKYCHKSWREGVRHRAKRLFLGLPREWHYNSFYTPKNV